MVNFIGKRFSATKFAKSFILRSAQEKIDEFCAGFEADGQGQRSPALAQARIQILIKHDVSLEVFLTKQAGPETVAKLKTEAAKYANFARTITEAEFLAMLPPWWQAAVDASGPKGQAWKARELGALRKLFGMGG